METLSCPDSVSTHFSKVISHIVFWTCFNHVVESSENSVIELIDEFKAVNYEKLKAAALQVNMFTNTHLDAIKNAPNNAKKQEVILAALMDMLKPQLIHFIRSLATQGN